MRPSQGGAGQDRGRKAPPTADPPEQEKKRLEERLQQAEDALRQLEAELQAFQKSCLLQLARSSWVGRVLRSSTGSVEVSLAMGGPPAHPPWSAGCPLQTGASTQGPWPPWRPASWTRDEQPSLWSLPPCSQQVCASGAGEAGGQSGLGQRAVLPAPAPACWPPVPFAGGDGRDPDGPQ